MFRSPLFTSQTLYLMNFATPPEGVLLPTYSGTRPGGFMPSSWPAKR